MKKNKKKIKPYKEFPHLVGSGIQKLYKFDNGYGASVVRFTIPYCFSCSKTGFFDVSQDGQEYGSYTSNENEWELAVIKWDGDVYGLDYDTPITQDVMGHLSNEEVEEVLLKIKSLP